MKLNFVPKVYKSPRLVLLALTIFFFQSMYAQKYSNEFLSIGVGARAQGMGGAVVAGVSDVTAGLWNPAGLTNNIADNKIQIGAMHAEWFAGVGKFDYLAAAMPISDKRILGASIIRFGVDNIPNTLSLYDDDGTVNYDNIVQFSAADYALALSYAQFVTTKKGKLSIGGNVKIVHRSIGSFASSWGFGIDLAAQYQRGNWQFGLMGKDISTTFNAWQFNLTDDEAQVLGATGNDLPINSVEITKPQLILGVAYYKQWKKIGLLSELNLNATTDGTRNTLISADPISIAPVLGLEGNFKQFVFLRLGVNNVQEDIDLGKEKYWTVQPNLGLGIKIYNISIDYAFTDIGEQRNDTYSHVFSLMFNIGRKKQL